MIEFGCGDSNQLSLYFFPNYIGLDVSRNAIKLCMERFKKDKTKSFFLYDPEYYKDNYSIFKTDLALSVDVIFHLVEDNIFNLYMEHLFSSSKKFIIIYSSNTDNNKGYVEPHCKNRKFTKWAEEKVTEWKLINKIENRYPKESLSNFYIFQKKL